MSRGLYFWIVTAVAGERPAAFHIANLLLLLILIALLHRIVSRLAGARAALFAAAFLGLHYAADVPVAWASGSQDLLAVVFTLLALDLHLARRGALAALALTIALLSKEAVALAAPVALALDAWQSESLRDAARRSLGLFAVTAAWAVAWLATLAGRPAAAGTLSFHAAGAVAAIAHLLQVVPGLELHGSAPTGAMLAGGLALAAAAALVLFGLAPPEPARTRPTRAWRGDAARVGAAWALCGTAPLALVAPIWSAYFYLFALCGAALAIGAVLARMPRAAACAVLAALVLLSAQARTRDEFAVTRDAWAPLSHVNLHYLRRSTVTVARYLRAMKAARPTLPAHSTVFFADVPLALGWQAGDGPLLRWAYHDSTLRSYFLSEFTRERATRGPVFFFAVEGDSLRDRTSRPELLPSFAYSMLLGGRPRAAADALDLALERAPREHRLLYWRAWTRWATGDTTGAQRDLIAAGLRLDRTIPAATRAGLAAGGPDTAAWLARLGRARDGAALDPWAHARLAAIGLAVPDGRPAAVIEAFAYRTLEPGDPDAWRKWAAAQLAERRYDAALASLETYLRLAGPRGDADLEAARVLAHLRELVRGEAGRHAVRD